MNPAKIAELASSTIAALDSGVPIPIEPAEWLRNGMTALLAGNDVRAALNLKQRHGKRAEKAVQLANRDALIRKAILHIDPEGVSQKRAAARVASILSGEEQPPSELADITSSIRESGTVGARQIVRIVSAEQTRRADEAGTLNALLCRWSTRA